MTNKPQTKKPKDKEINYGFRVSKHEKELIEQNAVKFGFHSTSEFIRYVTLNVKDIIIKL
jgi:hypothetical protein